MFIKLKYGNTNTFLIFGGNGNLLVDTDYAGTMQLFYKEIKKNNIKIKDIDYVLATHYHPDHIGLISALMKQGVKLLLIDKQSQYVHFSDSIFNKEKHLKYEPINEKNAIRIKCEDSRNFLESMGIKGEIISTSSHSKDSISLILDDGICFVGDLEPINYLDAYNDNKKLEEDWKLVLNYYPKVVYYAHANKKCFDHENRGNSCVK